MQERNKIKGKRAKIDKALFRTKRKCRDMIEGQRSTPSIQTTQFKTEIKMIFLLF